MNERKKSWENVDKKQKAREKMPKFVIKFLAFFLLTSLIFLFVPKKVTKGMLFFSSEICNNTESIVKGQKVFRPCM